jgi:flavodoxin
MKALVIYDSVHGNTKAIAQAIGDAIPGDVEVLHAGEVNTAEVESCDLLIVGSPTYGGRPTEAMRGFLNGLRAASIEGTDVAAFDTRLAARWVRIFGFAAPRIARALRKKGGTPAGSPEGFIVKGTEGPLEEGEVERAAAWAAEVVEKST